MTDSELLLWIIVAIVSIEFVLERILSYLNVKNSSPQLPPHLKEIYDEEKYRKSQAYMLAKEKLSWVSSTVLFLATTLMLLLGGFGWIDQTISTYTNNLFWHTLLFFGIVGLAADVLNIPFEWYSIFVIEEKFGFNKMNLKTYVTDKLKGWLLSAILGGALLSAFIWFYESFRDYFWLYAWILFMGFSLLMMMFYTSWIVPLFNKLTPLPDGDLRKAIEDYAQKVHFPLKNIMVMDGSKRSTKANAYFSGIGSTKNIVLYDTLIEKHSVNELVAVLAHEVGHYKKKHTLQMFLLSALTTLFTLYVLSVFVENPLLSQALGGKNTSLALGLIAFSILYSPISMVTGLLINVLSRKNEYEADAYAASTSSSTDLATALKKLSVDTLSNLTPHSAYVFFYYSHPPLLRRLNALFQNKN
ncbi:MAG: M48 family metallopeptidase [Flammeovirgaceae bacterium]|nr:M48 family metallopeptidase [Flammeovirgaceae bacterium]MDW8287442.1 M48 family metallopeptidase [Flammeovirgaceae bacterium]